MAVSSSFKQACPSCEALVPIKDASMVGKKVDCPKCKYRFQVEKPKPAKDSKGPKKFRDDDEDDDKDLDEEEELEELDDLDELDEEEDEAPPAKSKPQVKAPAKSKPQVKKSKVEEDEEEELEEEDERPKKAAAKKGKDDDEEEILDEDEEEIEEEDGEDDKKKKKKGSKLVLGLALAGVGVVVLGVAAFMIMGSGGSTAAKVGAKPPPPMAGKSDAPPPEQKQAEAGQPKEEVKPKQDEKEAPKVAEAAGPSNEVELVTMTHFLPNDTDHVLHVFNRDIFELNSPLREATFNPAGGLDDAMLRKKLGFSLLAVDDLLHAENYKGAGWSFTILHFREPVSEGEVKVALNLKPQQPIKNQPYFLMDESNPWFDQLARLSFGVPVSLRQLDSRPANRPGYVRFQGPQTLIIGDKAPMEAFLQAEGAFPMLSNRGGAAGADPANPAPAPTSPLEGTNWEGKEERQPGAIRIELVAGNQAKLIDGKETIMGGYEFDNQTKVTFTFPGRGVYSGTLDNKTISGEAKDDQNKTWKFSVTQARQGLILGADLRAEMYLTISPELKKLLDKMEAKTPGQKLLYSAATNMETARIAGALPDVKDRITRRPRQVWDVGLMLTETKPRMKFLGAGLTYKDRTYQYRNDVVCSQEVDVKELQKDLVERVAPQISRFFDKLLGQRVDLPKIEATAATPPGTPPAPVPMPNTTTPMPAPPDHSQMTTVTNGPILEFKLDLVLDTPGLNRVFGVAAMRAGALRAEMDLFGILPARHELARAGRLLAEKGLSEREVPAGQWPPGAFPRPAATRPEREPLQRVSWMAGLLPFLGQEVLYSRIEFKDSWRDPANWLTAQTLVPQFLDPTYPDSARRAQAPGIPVDVGATHFVGIAGVGLDAATYRPGDPATNHKRGVLNYERSLSIDEVQKGRGAANTILMIQVPHDGVAGVTPWIAGGGSTLRGVPEKNSIAPFVLSTDRSGKFIQHQGKRGTFALMSDGSVRFIDQLVDDNVFKAMCTASGPAPEKFDLDKDENTPLVPDPNRKAVPKAKTKTPAKAPASAPAPAKEEDKKAATETKTDAKKPAPELTAPPAELKKLEEKKAPPELTAPPAELKKKLEEKK